MEVLQWLRDNLLFISTLINIAMLGIWTFYAFLFYQQYERQRRPKIIVHLTNWFAKEAECLVVNLTREPVHIEGVLIASGDDGKALKMVTGGEDLSSQMRDGRSVESVIKQGPLQSGATIELGRLSELIERALPEFLEQASNGDTCYVEIRVAAIGPVDRLFGARRRFHIESVDDGYRVHPESIHTEQLISRKANREVTQWLDEASESSSALIFQDIRTPSR